MNEELQTKMYSTLSRFIDTLTETGALVKNETPEVLKELIMFNTIYHTFLLVLGILVVIAGALMLKKVIIGNWGNKDNNEGWGDSATAGPRFVLMIFSIPATLIGIIITTLNLKETLMLYFAPKVWLIEYISDTLKSLPAG